MSELLEKIILCLEKGKVDKDSRHPADLAGQDGVDELVARALDSGMEARQVLSEGLVEGMARVGKKFKENEIFLPDVLMAAKAMTAGMNHLKPFFVSGEVQHKGSIVLGTVAGDLHDIGKKIVGMILEGGGWRVIDIGQNAGHDQYLAAIAEHQPQAAGLSALLTTTMVSMKEITEQIRAAHPEVKVIVGGAPVTAEFAESIGAHAYSPDPHGALDYLNRNC